MSPTQAIDTLSNELLDGVIDQIRVSMISATQRANREMIPSRVSTEKETGHLEISRWPVLQNR
jgi:hypothetical protein